MKNLITIMIVNSNQNTLEYQNPSRNKENHYNKDILYQISKLGCPGALTPIPANLFQN